MTITKLFLHFWLLNGIERLFWADSSIGRHLFRLVVRQKSDSFSRECHRVRDIGIDALLDAYRISTHRMHAIPLALVFKPLVVSSVDQLDKFIITSICISSW